MLQSEYIPINLALSCAGNCEPRTELTLTSFVNRIRNLARERRQENKNIVASVEEDIKKNIILDETHVLDWEK